MILYRSPKSGNKWNNTDTIKPNEYIKNWKPGKIIKFDGTIDKQGERHTDIGIKLFEDDIESLTRSLFKFYKEKINEKEERIKKLDENLKDAHHECRFLREGLMLLYEVLADLPDKIPSKQVLTKAFRELATFYLQPDLNTETLPKIDWINWDTFLANSTNIYPDSITQELHRNRKHKKRASRAKPESP